MRLLQGSSRLAVQAGASFNTIVRMDMGVAAVSGRWTSGPGETCGTSAVTRPGGAADVLHAYCHPVMVLS